MTGFTRPTMARFACVHVDHFLAAAHIRAEPTLGERPLAVLAGTPPTSRVADANRVARGSAVVPGITEADARARCPALVTRAVSEERTDSARHALLEAAFGVSPRIEDAAPGVVYVDVAGLGRLFGDDRTVGDRLHRAARRVGLDATVAVAGTRTTARVIARVSTRVTVVDPGQDPVALAPVPLAALGLEPALTATLARWGVRTLGDLAALPRAGVATRLGGAGSRAQDDALGVDRAPFRPWTPPAYWEEAQGVDWEIGTWEGLEPLLSSVLERLVGRLEAAHLAADGVRVDLALASGGTDERFVAFAHPLVDAKSMLALIALDVVGRPPGAAVTRVGLSVRAVPPAPGQPGLWQLPVPTGRDLATTLARLASLVGPEYVGSPVMFDSHGDDRVALTGFLPGGGSDLRPVVEDGRGSAADVRALGGVGGHVGAPHVMGVFTAPLAFRRLRPPRPVVVETTDGEPVRITLGTTAEPIVRRVGPWRTSGEWWDDRRWATDEWDVVLGDGMVCRLVYDILGDGWFLAGAYD